MAYSPDTEAFYIPLTLNCQRSTYIEIEQIEGGGSGGLGRRENLFHPDSGGNLGEFVAMSVTGEVLWSQRIGLMPRGTATSGCGQTGLS